MTDEIQPIDEGPKVPSMGLQMGKWLFCGLAGLVAQKYAGLAFDNFKDLLERRQPPPA